MNKITSNELYEVKKYINNNVNLLVLDLRRKVENNRIYSIKENDTSLFFYDNNYCTNPKIYNKFRLIYSNEVHKQRVKDKDFISNRIMNIYHLQNQKDIIKNIIFNLDLEDEESIIQELSIFYSKYDICLSIYNDLIKSYKGKRKDYSLDQEEFENYCNKISKNYNVNLTYEETYSNSNRLNHKNILFNYLSEKSYELDYDDIYLSYIKIYQDTDKKEVDERILTPNVIYELINDNIIDFKITDTHIKKSKMRYSQIYLSVITDNIYSDEDNIKSQIVKTKNSKRTQDKLLFKKIEEDFNIKILQHNENLISIEVLGSKLLINDNEEIEEFGISIKYQDNSLFFSFNNEVEIYKIDNKSIKRFIPRKRKETYIINVDKVPREVIDNTDYSQLNSHFF